MRMIAPLRALLTAAWMLRKRHFLSCLRRSLRFLACALPLNDFLMSLLELPLQTVRTCLALLR
jgi:hypothetical protein